MLTRRLRLEAPDDKADHAPRPAVTQKTMTPRRRASPGSRRASRVRSRLTAAYLPGAACRTTGRRRPLPLARTRLRPAMTRTRHRRRPPGRRRPGRRSRRTRPAGKSGQGRSTGGPGTGGRAPRSRRAKGTCRPRTGTRPAPMPTAFLPPVPAGYPQPSFQPFDYPEAPPRPAPRFVPAERGAHARRPGQPHQGPRAGRRPGAGDRAAAGRRDHLAQPGPVEQGDGARHARVPGHRVPAHVRAGDRPRPVHHRRRLQQLPTRCRTPSTT